jgi:hypothetical protein
MLHACGEFGDKLCVAIRNELTKNSTLEELILDKVIPSDDGGAVSVRNALSFLRYNSTLKSLTVSLVRAQKESFVSAFRFEAVKILQNTLLESLTIIWRYVVLVLKTVVCSTLRRFPPMAS